MGVGAPCDITVVMTAHHEGRLAHHTMRSLFRARTYAVERGISVATIVVLDRPDEATERHFSSYAGRPDIVISRADTATSACRAITASPSLQERTWRFSTPTISSA